MKRITSVFLAVVIIAAICVSTAILSYAENENLALNKPLVGIDPIDGDDTRKGNLTDGKHPEAGKGWSIGSGEAGAENYMIIVKDKNADASGVAEGVIDLKANCEVSEVKVYIGTGVTNYKLYAPSVTVSLSTDGTNYTEFGKYTPEDPNKEFWDFVPISGAKTTARYAKVTFTLNGGMALVAEVQVMGTAGAPIDTPPVVESSSTESTASTESTSSTVSTASSEAESASEVESTTETESKTESKVETSSNTSSSNNSETEKGSSSSALPIVIAVVAVVVIAAGVAFALSRKRGK